MRRPLDNWPPCSTCKYDCVWEGVGLGTTWNRTFRKSVAGQRSCCCCVFHFRINSTFSRTDIGQWRKAMTMVDELCVINIIVAIGIECKIVILLVPNISKTARSILRRQAHHIIQLTVFGICEERRRQYINRCNSDHVVILVWSSHTVGLGQLDEEHYITCPSKPVIDRARMDILRKGLILRFPWVILRKRVAYRTALTVDWHCLSVRGWLVSSQHRNRNEYEWDKTWFVGRSHNWSICR